MIRFINLTGQIFIDDPQVHFAWYDTVISQFMTICDSQDWHTWKEFEEDLIVHYRCLNVKGNIDKIITRFKRLYPPTVLFMEGCVELEESKNHPTNSALSSKE